MCYLLLCYVMQRGLAVVPGSCPPGDLLVSDTGKHCVWEISLRSARRPKLFAARRRLWCDTIHIIGVSVSVSVSLYARLPAYLLARSLACLAQLLLVAVASD